MNDVLYLVELIPVLTLATMCMQKPVAVRLIWLQCCVCAMGTVSQKQLKITNINLNLTISSYLDICYFVFVCQRMQNIKIA